MSNIYERWVELNEAFSVNENAELKRMANMSIADNLPSVLKELRRKKGWNQGQVADSIGVSRQAYSYYERGERNPPLDTLKKIAELHGVTVNRLIDEENYSEDEKKRPPSTATAAVILNAIEINNEESIGVLQRLLVHDGEQLSEDQVREILAIARYQLARKQSSN
ncbi:helix-turn-helix transcriptional regulator [Paenibacillus pasadenensis]|uniref:helix-turn-helix transcriptional regulator n=1 Tax=Paenibacillus pasadenensis TaxID=217090 RepID=UPI00203AA965|nr:helix-turn-helix transcriptional regulator [Paenibacillus pasadenensis]MCM3746570.1 helix-turn-helix transcriptional regulator [Paenibacillus pasadenensis]